MTEGTVSLHTVHVSPLPVLPSLDAVLDVAPVRRAGLPQGASAGLLGVGVDPVPLLPLVSQTVPDDESSGAKQTLLVDLLVYDALGHVHDLVELLV